MEMNDNKILKITKELDSLVYKINQMESDGSFSGDKENQDYIKYLFRCFDLKIKELSDILMAQEI